MSVSRIGTGATMLLVLLLTECRKPPDAGKGPEVSAQGTQGRPAPLPAGWLALDSLPEVVRNAVMDGSAVSR